MPHNILIIDFGSQYTQLIARRVREIGVYSEIVPYQLVEAKFAEIQPHAIILSGGPASTTEIESPQVPSIVFESSIPVLGICYGQMTMSAQLGGKTESSNHREFGRAFLNIEKECQLFDGVWQVGSQHQVWMSHGDRVIDIPTGFEIFAKSESAPFAVIGSRQRNYYGLMFHPEVVHTPDGEAIIKNFVVNVSQCQPDWSMTTFKQQAISSIQKKVGKSKVICGLSGGVDSSVAAVLIHEAIGDQLTCIFVDHGLLRAGEADQVISLFREHYNIELIHVNASKRFLEALNGIEEPESKRKAIGKHFIEVFEQEANKIGADYLAQGTLYPDVIESVSSFGGPSVTIKSHHNVGGLPERMNLKLVEPLRELFKDEVRNLGIELGLPNTFVDRHPFPGPGLAIRCLGQVTPEKIKILQQVDTIFLDEIRKAGLYDSIWQAFAVLLPVKSVGVMGDGRTYEQVCSLRAVTSVDGMTADFYHFDMEFLGKISTRIVNEVRGINRVVYDITSKPPGTIEWE